MRHISIEQRQVIAQMAPLLPRGTSRPARVAVCFCRRSDGDEVVGNRAAWRGQGFWDLHGLIRFRQINLGHALHEFERKFATHDCGSVIRSLAYFGDADAEPLPRGLAREHWQIIKDDVRAWVTSLG